MKFLDDAKNAKFAADLLAAAGFNLEDLRKSGDANALKAAVEQKTSQGPSAADLEAAVTENQKLEAAVKAVTAEVDGLKTSAKTHAQVADALAANGIKLVETIDDNGFSAEKFKVVFNTAVATASRVALSRAGHSPIEEEITTVTTAKPTAPAKLTGRDRVEWSFNQQVSSRN